MNEHQIEYALNQLSKNLREQGKSAPEIIHSKKLFKECMLDGMFTLKEARDIYKNNQSSKLKDYL